MTALLTLWLPILLSAVVVFVISSLIHMVFKWHNPDYRRFGNEDAVRDAIRAGNPTPGHYVMPHCGDMKQMGSEAMQKKYREGPVAHVMIAPSGVPNMGKHLGLWFLWSLVVAAVAALLVVRLLGLNHEHARAAAKLVGAVTFIAYGFGTIQESIWVARSWSSSVKHLLDAALYGVGSGFVFYFLWP
jgi:hypothetical protein